MPSTGRKAAAGGVIGALAIGGAAGGDDLLRTIRGGKGVVDPPPLRDPVVDPVPPRDPPPAPQATPAAGVLEQARNEGGVAMDVACAAISYHENVAAEGSSYGAFILWLDDELEAQTEAGKLVSIYEAARDLWLEGDLESAVEFGCSF